MGGTAITSFVAPESLEELSFPPETCADLSLSEMDVTALSHLTAYELERVTLPSGIESFDGVGFEPLAAFDLSGCGKLKALDYRAFSRCVARKDVVFPQGLTALGDEALAAERELAANDGLLVDQLGCGRGCRGEAGLASRERGQGHRGHPAGRRRALSDYHRVRLRGINAFPGQGGLC